MRTEDGHIIRECLNGDSASFGLLVDKYKESIYALAYSRLRNFHDAEDITQDVFLKAYRNLRTLRRWDSFLVWIRSIAINLCKNKIRAQSRRPDAESIEDQEAQILDKVSAEFYSDEQSSVSRNEALDSISKALESLPEIYQQVLTLHYLGGMSGEQMSQFLGISHANVRQRLSRARRQLREETLATMSSTYEQQRLPAGFTFRIVEAVKHIKIHPMPRMAGLPWGLSIVTGIFLTVISINPYLDIPNSVKGSMFPSLPSDSTVLERGEIPVEVLRVSSAPVIANDDGDKAFAAAAIPQKWQDDFNDKEIGENWMQGAHLSPDQVNLKPNWWIEDGILKGSWPYWNAQFVILDYPPQNYTMQVKCRIDQVYESPDLASAGFIFHVSAPDVFDSPKCAFIIQPYRASFYFGHGMDGGEFLAPKQQEYAIGQWYTLKLVVSGDKLTGYVDNKMVSRIHNDYGYEGNYVGLCIGSNIDASFDDFIISNQVETGLSLAGSSSTTTWASMKEQ